MKSIEYHPPHPNFHLPLIDDFTEALLKEKQPEITGETGTEINRIIEEIYAS